MGRRPCCSKEGLNRGAWTALEDKILTAYIKAHGEGKWRNLPKRAGLKRCGKSCRLRWLNYLRPDIKRGNISLDEEELIIRLHNLLGNRWSLIAGRLPGRTDNEIKNYWNTTLAKKVQAQPSSTPSPTKQRPVSRKKQKRPTTAPPVTAPPPTPPSLEKTPPQVIRTKAMRCTRVTVPPPYQPALASLDNNQTINLGTMNSELQAQQSNSVALKDSENLRVDFGAGEQLCVPSSSDFNFLHFDQDDKNNNNNLSTTSDHSLLLDESMLDDWAGSGSLEQDLALDLGFVASFLDSEKWP